VVQVMQTEPMAQAQAVQMTMAQEQAVQMAVKIARNHRQ
jgi:hypothetical protein